MYKRGVLLSLVILALFASFVSASDNETNATNTVEEAYSWLYNQMNSSGWNREPGEIALTILALGGEGYNVSPGIERLRQVEYGDNWGNVKDSAFATLALHRSGEDVTPEINWLKSQQIVAFDDGNWYVQLKINEGQEGECTINNKEFDFLEGLETAPNCGPSHWIDYEECIKDDLISTYEEISMQCTDLGSPQSVAIYKSNNGDFFLFDQSSYRHPLEIKNGCFPNVQGINCDCDNSGYAGWVLTRLREDTLIIPYMNFGCPSNPVTNSFLYILTSSPTYLNELKQNQAGDGSWGEENYGGDLRATTLALLALNGHSGTSEVIQEGKTWIESQQSEMDGSWNSNIEDTALILYVLYSDAFSNIPSDTASDVVCGDAILEGNEDCEEISYNTCSLTEVCVECTCVAGNETDAPIDVPSECGNGVCDTGFSGETCINCPEDCADLCAAADDVDDAEDDEPFFCDDDDDCYFDEECKDGECVPKKAGGWLKWLIIILSIILGLGIFYYVYMKYFKGKLGKPKPSMPSQPKQPPFKMARSSIPARQPTAGYPSKREQRMEGDLEKSLKNARELLKK